MKSTPWPIFFPVLLSMPSWRSLVSVIADIAMS